MEGRNDQKCIVSHANVSLMVKDASKNKGLHLDHVLRVSVAVSTYMRDGEHDWRSNWSVLGQTEVVSVVADSGDRDEDEEERSNVASELLRRCLSGPGGRTQC